MCLNVFFYFEVDPLLENIWLVCFLKCQSNLFRECDEILVTRCSNAKRTHNLACLVMGVYFVMLRRFFPEDHQCSGPAHFVLHSDSPLKVVLHSCVQKNPHKFCWDLPTAEWRKRRKFITGWFRFCNICIDESTAVLFLQHSHRGSVTQHSNWLLTLYVNVTYNSAWPVSTARCLPLNPQEVFCPAVKTLWFTVTCLSAQHKICQTQVCIWLFLHF